MDEGKVIRLAIETYGEETQEITAMEECAELIQAISHKRRGRPHNIAEEIADVEIVLEHLKVINGCRAETAGIRRRKIKRLYDRVIGVMV